MTDPDKNKVKRGFNRAGQQKTLTPRNRDYVHNANRFVDKARGVTLLMQAVDDDKPQMVERIVLSRAKIDAVDVSGQSALHRAIAAGNITMARLLLDLGADARLVAKDGQSALTLALAKAETAVLALDLLAAGADADHINNDKQTPLMLAAQLSDGLAEGEALIDRLIETVRKPEQWDGRGRNALHHAAYAGQRRTLARLLDHGLDPMTATFDGATVLHLALTMQHEQIALDLLDRGLDGLVAAADSQDETALHLAVRKGMSDAARVLMARGANIQAQSTYGFSPLHVAAQTGRLDLAKEMLAYGAVLDLRALKDGMTPLTMALQNDNYDIAEYFLHAGADPNAARKDSLATPLMLIAKSGRADLLTLALGYGGDVMRQDDAGNTVLHYATNGLSLASLQQVLAAGNILEVANKGGQTPLLYAAAMGNGALLRNLINVGAKVNVADVNGMTPLTLAVLYDNADVISALFLAGADVQTPNSMNGLTPLHYATATGNQREIARLVSRGAKVDVKDKKGRTPLHHLSACYAYAVRDASLHLLAHGADILARDVHGATPYDYAYTRNNRVLTGIFDRALKKERRYHRPRYVQHEHMPEVFVYRSLW